MTMFKVIQTVRNSDGDLVEIPFYKGSDRLEALHAVFTAGKDMGDLPWSEPVSVRMDWVDG